MPVILNNNNNNNSINIADGFRLRSTFSIDGSGGMDGNIAKPNDLVVIINYVNNSNYNWNDHYSQGDILKNQISHYTENEISEDTRGRGYLGSCLIREENSYTCMMSIYKFIDEDIYSIYVGNFDIDGNTVEPKWTLAFFENSSPYNLNFKEKSSEPISSDTQIEISDIEKDDIIIMSTAVQIWNTNALGSLRQSWDQLMDFSVRGTFYKTITGGIGNNTYDRVIITALASAHENESKLWQPLVGSGSYMVFSVK